VVPVFSPILESEHEAPLSNSADRVRRRRRQAHAAIGSLLQLMDEASDDQIATEARRRSGAMQLAPTNPQILRRSIGQAGNLALDIGNVSTARSIALFAVPVANRRRLA